MTPALLTLDPRHFDLRPPVEIRQAIDLQSKNRLIHRAITVFLTYL